MEVILKNVRLSFADLYTPKKFKNSQGEPRYNATLLVEPGSDNDAKIREAIEQMADEKYGKAAGKTLQKIRGNSGTFCYQDGDLSDYEGYAGLWALACHRKEKDGPPLVLDTFKENGSLRRIPENEGKVYSGCYVNAKVDVWAQDGEYTGIRASFSAVQFSKDGDAFSGAGRPTEAGFDELAVENDDLS